MTSFVVSTIQFPDFGFQIIWALFIIQMQNITKEYKLFDIWICRYRNNFRGSNKKHFFIIEIKICLMLYNNSVPELRNFKKNLLIPVIIHTNIERNFHEANSEFSFILTLLFFYDRRRRLRNFWMVSNKYLMTMIDWILCKNHEGRKCQKGSSKNILLYTFELCTVVHTLIWTF